MSYLKQTVISGFKTADKQRDHTTLCVSVLRGHWSDDSIINSVKRRALDPTTVKFRHDVSDLSGKGRSTHGGEFKITEHYDIVRLSEDEDVDDSQDMHDLWDEVSA
jgi:hypothetical protein